MKTLEYPTSISKENFIHLIHKYGYQYLDIPNTNKLKIANNYGGKSFYTKEYSSIDINYAEILRDIGQFNPGPYEGEVYLSKDICIEYVSSLNSDFSPEDILKFKHGIAFCPKDDLEEVLKIAFDNFFTISNGKIIFVRLDLTSYSRSSFLRGNYTIDNYPEIYEKMVSDFQGFKTLSKWLMIENHEYFFSLISFAQYFFSPFISGFMCHWKFGIHFILIPEKSTEFKLGKFPRDILDFVRSYSEIANDMSLRTIKTKSNLLSKYCFEQPPSLEDNLNFINWILYKSEKLISFNLDICNFTKSDDNSAIDPLYAYEYNFSIMHIIKISVTILGSHNSYENKNNMFMVADLLDGICTISTITQKTEFFKKLFSKTYTNAVLIPIIENSGLNSNNIAMLKKVINEIFDSLHQTIKESIWLKYKINGDDISVLNKDLKNNKIENIDEFASKVIRALRNTHHGYITREDEKQSRPARYLSLITGELPSTLPSLVFIWMICLLSDREKFVGNP